MSFNKNAKAFITAAEDKFGVAAVVTRDDINRVVHETGVPYPYWLVSKAEYRAGHGKYSIPDIGSPRKVATPEPELEMALMQSSAQVVQLRQPKLLDESDASIPAIYPDYVPFGFFTDLHKIINSKAVSYTHLTLPTIYSV